MGRKRIYSLNENYFSNVDNKNKAYILGFIFADGSIYKNYLSFSLSSNDSEILEFIKKELCYNGPIYYKNGYCKLTISSKIIVNDLMKCGIEKNKTYTSKKLPLINDNLFSAFILGFFDGDGSIYKASKIKNYEYCVNFSNNLNVLSELKKILNKFNISSSSIRRRYTNDISCMLDIKGSQNIEKIYNLFYNSPPKFFLIRKKNKFDDFKSAIKALSKRRFKDEIIRKINDLYVDGKSQKEISKILKLNYSSVRCVVQRLRKIKKL